MFMKHGFSFLKIIITVSAACLILCLTAFASRLTAYVWPAVPQAVEPISSDEPLPSILIPAFVEEMYEDDVPSINDDPENLEFSCEIPESEPVDDSYFKDAVFIGDSRTVGMGMFGNIKSNYYAKVSLKIDTVFNSRFVSLDGHEEPLTVLEAIAEDPKFTKVYISFGVNELGYNRNVFINAYKLFVSQVRELLPDATIYVQSIFPVSEAVSEKNRFGVNNNAVASFNEAIKEMANEMKLFYVDTFTLLADENGALPTSISSDGIHLGPGKYSVMVSDYLRTHTAVYIDEDAYAGPKDYGNGYVLDYLFSLD